MVADDLGGYRIGDAHRARAQPHVVGAEKTGGDGDTYRIDI